MAKIHVLDGDHNNLYRVVVHAPVPAGNNAAGVPWIEAIKSSGRTTSVMTEGTGPGQITAAELAQITAGTLIEGTFNWGDDPAWTNTQRQADLDMRAQQMVDEITARYAAALKFYGFIRS